MVHVVRPPMHVVPDGLTIVTPFSTVSGEDCCSGAFDAMTNASATTDMTNALAHVMALMSLIGVVSDMSCDIARRVFRV